mmetsp:Transcript_5738/g.8371  ORF Transcript_5738/g.8371 Transcript_5738/m.8371 type:complete len:92 (-) Transcript_5738:102-377(-)
MFHVTSPEPLSLIAEAIMLKNMSLSSLDFLRRVVIFVLMASISASTSCCERVPVKVAGRIRGVVTVFILHCYLLIQMQSFLFPFYLAQVIG